MIEQYLNKIIHANCETTLKQLPDNSVDLVLTSPPYFQQREYGGGGIGNEQSIEQYIDNLMAIFKECVRVTKTTGSIVFNVGDKYIDGNLLLIPYRFALAVQSQTDVRLINELTWTKVNPTPKQDPRKLVSSKEPFFIFAKTAGYYFDKDGFMSHRDQLNGKKKDNSNSDIGKKYFDLLEQSDLSTEQKNLARKELSTVITQVKRGELDSFRMKIKGLHALPYGGQAGGRLTQIENNGFTIIKIHGKAIRKDVIESTVETIKGNFHPAVYPEFVVQEIIKLLSKDGDIVLDPFMGSGTTAVVAKRLQRNYIGIEIFEEYIKLAEERLKTIQQPYLELFV